LGGLPNYTYEARKPVPYRITFWNGMCCLSRNFEYQDIVINPAEMQVTKDYFQEDSHMPDRSITPSHTSEALQQIKRADLQKDCSWLGSDVWFGTVCFMVEAQIRFDSRKTSIFKNT
jgi:hypothetical protein